MITLETIQQAADMLKGHIIQTPMVYSPTLSRKFNAHIYLKLENLQKTGSFKIRGATYKLLRSVEQGNISPEGVVAASAGNHAQGVALGAHKLGIPATIVMPRWASISKQEATKNYGGTVIIHGNTIEESLKKATDMATKGLILIHPFDDLDIIAGQATIGTEIMTELPDVDSILVPIGGGGLIAGISLAVKAVRPTTRIVGIEAAACPSAAASLKAGKCVPVTARSSIADGISVKQLGKKPFQIIKHHMDQLVTVEEEHIAASVQTLLERKKVLAEGAGAVPLAALMSGSLKPRTGEKIVLLVSGGNVDIPLLGRILHKGLLNNDRIMRLRLKICDRPGSLARLLGHIASLEANVLNIQHDRSVYRTSIDETQVDLELETRNKDHKKDILNAIEKAGYHPESTHT